MKDLHGFCGHNAYCAICQFENIMKMGDNSTEYRKKYIDAGIGFLILFGIYLTSHYNYLLFHSLAELFSIVVAFSIFVIAWNSRRIIENTYLLFAGISYLFIALLDTLHTLAYKGMGVFTGYDANLPTQLWIASRYVESAVFFLAPFYIKRKIRARVLIAAELGVVMLLIGSIFVWDAFPDCFVEGKGLTAFKKTSEYIIALILFAAFLHLRAKRGYFDVGVFRLLSASIFLTILSEIFFTFYISVYGISNLVGHILKIISFYLLYKAIVVTGLAQPYRLLFRELRQRENEILKERDKAKQYLDIAGVMLVVLDGSGSIVLMNRKGYDVLKCSEDKIIGKDWFDNFVPARIRDEVRDVFQKLMAGETKLFEFHENPLITRENEERLILFHNTVIRNEAGEITGILFSGEDITDQKLAEEERERLIEQLQKALSEVKTLSGFLPICASCKKIRDDAGYWQQIETYISKHSDTEFSHGICPDCAEKLMQEFKEMQIDEKSKRHGPEKNNNT